MLENESVPSWLQVSLHTVLPTAHKANELIRPTHVGQTAGLQPKYLWAV